MDTSFPLPHSTDKGQEINGEEGGREGGREGAEEEREGGGARTYTQVQWRE